MRVGPDPRLTAPLRGSIGCPLFYYSCSRGPSLAHRDQGRVCGTRRKEHPPPLPSVGSHSQGSESIAHQPTPHSQVLLQLWAVTVPRTCPGHAFPPPPGGLPPHASLTQAPSEHIFIVTVCCSWLHLGGLWHSPCALPGRAQPRHSPVSAKRSPRGSQGRGHLSAEVRGFRLGFHGP